MKDKRATRRAFLPVGSLETVRIGSGRPRLPAALLLVIGVLCLALAMHAAVGDHVMAMLGACMAVLVAIALTSWVPSTSTLQLVMSDEPAIRWITPGASPPRGRYPPDEGSVLRH